MVAYKCSFSRIRRAKKAKHRTFSLFSAYEISQTHFHKRSVSCVFFKVRGTAVLMPWLPLQVLSIAMASWKWSYFMTSLWGSFQRKAASAENGYSLYTARYTLSNLYKLLPSFSSSALFSLNYVLALPTKTTMADFRQNGVKAKRDSRDTPNALLARNYLDVVFQVFANSPTRWCIHTHERY